VNDYSLRSYDYPGNVRELENLIERALILSTGPQIEAGEWLPLSLIELTGLSKSQLLERAHIKRLLELHHSNLGEVAEALKMSRTTLWRRIKDYCLQSESVSDPDVSA
jgi:DNA-binding NtrC family response regulator